MVEIARMAGRPYGSVLLHRPAGVLPAADLAPGLRSFGEQAAAKAVAAGSCAADLSSLHLLSLLDENDRLRVRARLPDLIVPRAAVGDAQLTRDHLRGVTAATYIASLAADGSIDRTTLTAVQQDRLRRQSESLEAITSAADVRYPAKPGDAAASALSLAAENSLALWCDDQHGLQRARANHVAAFSLLDLLTVLSRDGIPFDLPAVCRRLACHYVVDLPLSGQDLVEIAASSEWQPGPAHTALARTGWWRHHGTGWEDDWLQIATQARAHSEEALPSITKAALNGALHYVSSSRITQRYQQIAACALLGCHYAEHRAPDDLLDQLAEQWAPHVVPRPHFILRALIDKLQQRNIPDALDVAMRLLPGVEFLP